ncbi:Translation elongation factor [Operophtera brumata]|uniref:Translation elongation factor n=1 Tax=Operophtera brumata TaxID=104452 RepID=A0A0L7KZA8_OPEBR|nr:Translation elongation factor [Operophtera brumata]
MSSRWPSGKLYGALSRRGGRVLASDLQGGSASFRVRALLPVAESFRFALELRTHTMGLAAPQLLFMNRAKAYMDAVRTRKGLSTDKHLVQHAEKQRTLSKNK